MLLPHRAASISSCFILTTADLLMSRENTYCPLCFSWQVSDASFLGSGCTYSPVVVPCCASFPGFALLQLMMALPLYYGDVTVGEAKVYARPVHGAGVEVLHKDSSSEKILQVQ